MPRIERTSFPGDSVNTFENRIMIYQVVFQRSGCDVETVYWSGPLHETQKIARTIAFNWAADTFLIIDFDDTGAKIYSERGPFDGARSDRFRAPRPLID